MNMDGQIRVFTDAKYKELYNNMKSRGVVEDFHELFFVCACIGYRKKKRVPLDKREERFWSRTITPKEWACYYAMLLELNGNNFNVITDDKQVIATIQEFANGGMEVLIQDFLGNYLLPGQRDGDPQLDPQCTDELPKHFVHHIFEEAESEELG